MKIPKYIDKLIDRRTRLAFELFDACMKLDEWLEKNGWDYLTDDSLTDDTGVGVEIYMNPRESADRIREYIEKKL